jgi:signal transduction histidine kinase
MRARSSAAGALLAATPVVALLAAYVALALNVHDRDALGLPGAIPFDAAVAAAIGVVVLLRRPMHPAGWILVGLAIVVLLQIDGVLLAIIHYRNHADPLGAGSIPILAGLLWIPALLTVPPVVTLFPDGRVPTDRARIGLAIYAVLAVVVCGYFYLHALGDLTGGHVAINRATGDLAELDNPQGALAAWYAGWATLVVGGLVSSLALLTVKLRRASGETRQQLRWFFAAAALVATAIVPVVVISALGFPAGSPVNEIPAAYLAAALAALPVAVGVGVLRFHLYDLNLVISRSIAYGSLAAVLACIYLVVVVALSALVNDGSRSLGISMVATLLAAAAFQPLRTRAELLADRLVYGPRATPYEALTHLGDQLADTYDVERVLEDAAEVLAGATAAERADVWLCSDQGLLRPLAAWPSDAEPAELLPAAAALAEEADGNRTLAAVRHQGELLGAISITKRRGEVVSEIDRRLLHQLASQAGLVLHNAKLSSDLQRRLEDLVASRQRLVNAQDEARRRLERDLHDGAQQQLIALNMKLGRLEPHLREGDEGAREALEWLREDVDAALDGIRSISRGIYPPLLADRGLAAALRSHVRTAPVPVAVESALERRGTREVEAAAYFCVLEALQNVYRHAHATRALVRLRAEPELLRIEVADDGRGFDPATAVPGAGLTNISDRADSLGGRVQIDSGAGRGTTIAIELPL